MGTGGLGDLHGRAPDRPRGAVDQDASSLAQVGLAKTSLRDARPVGERGGVFEARPLRDVREGALLADADELGVRAAAEPEDAVADGELGDVLADRLDDSRELSADDLALRRAEARERAG